MSKIFFIHHDQHNLNVANIIYVLRDDPCWKTLLMSK